VTTALNQKHSRPTWQTLTRVVLGLIVLLVLAGWLLPRPAWTRYVPAGTACPAGGAHILVSSVHQTLVLCEEGQAVFAAPVRLGLRGMDKRQEGDRRTPTGTYFLATPRISGSGFGWFIEVAYPTAEQLEQGYTGSAIGIHGPFWAVLPVTSSAVYAWATWAIGWRPNTTAGCVAMESFRELMPVVEFVRRTNPDVQIDESMVD
jgi:hypothetical protein